MRLAAHAACWLFAALGAACGPVAAVGDGGIDASTDASTDGSVDDRPRRLIGWRAARTGSGLEIVELDPATGIGMPILYEPGVVEWRGPVVDEVAGALYVIGTREGGDEQRLFTLGAVDAVLQAEVVLDGPVEVLFTDAEGGLFAARASGERRLDLVAIDAASGVTRPIAVIDGLGALGGSSFAWDPVRDRVYQASGSTLYVIEGSTGVLVSQLAIVEPLSCLHVTRDGELRALVFSDTALDTRYVSVSAGDGSAVDLARHDAILGCAEARASDVHANRLYLRAAYRREPDTVRLFTFDSETGELLEEALLLEDVSALALLPPLSMASSTTDE